MVIGHCFDYETVGCVGIEFFDVSGVDVCWGAVCAQP